MTLALSCLNMYSELAKYQHAENIFTIKMNQVTDHHQAEYPLEGWHHSC